MESPVFLVVEAEVRYWEDAEVNGVEDHDGSLIPCREGNLWKPAIRLIDGQIMDWPQGTTAKIHYKVCDAGEYWLATDEITKSWRWRGNYVPSLLRTEGCGSGDYIIMQVNPDGGIIGWQEPELHADQWEFLP